MAAKKKVTEVINEVKEIEEPKEEVVNEEVKQEIVNESLTNSVEKLLNTAAEAIKKSSEQPKPEPQKKPFKLGFWGYLGLVIVVKGAVEIARAVADSKRPRR